MKNTVQGVQLDSPGTFFEDAMEALEIAQGRARVLEIKSKAHSMAELARRVCDSALTAEANMIARLANEKLTGMRDGEVQDRSIDLELRMLRRF
jgi:microcystin degradation protein MlrC